MFLGKVHVKLIGIGFPIVFDTDVLGVFASAEDFVEEDGVNTEDIVAFLPITVEPSVRNNDFKDGDVRGVHALGIQTMGLKHEIDMVRE